MMTGRDAGLHDALNMQEYMRIHEARSSRATGFSGLCVWGDRQRLIVPQGCPCSIVGAGGLNDRVRDGNGWVPSAIVTSPPTRTDALSKYDLQSMPEFAAIVKGQFSAFRRGALDCYVPSGVGEDRGPKRPTTFLHLVLRKNLARTQYGRLTCGQRIRHVILTWCHQPIATCWMEIPQTLLRRQRADHTSNP